MTIQMSFDTGSTSQEELKALAVFLSTIAVAALPASELRQHQKDLYGGTALQGIGEAQAASAPATTAPVEIASMTVLPDDASPADVAEAFANLVDKTGKRERGKPAPGKARRTKEELAEDEAAERAELSPGAAMVEDGKLSISTGEERVDPAEVEAQDKADEQAEVEQTRKDDKPLTIDDVKAVVTAYVGKYGMPAVQEDGPKIFVEALGAPPEGEAYWKMSLLPDDQAKLAKVVSVWQKAVELNPLKRAEV